MLCVFEKALFPAMGPWEQPGGGRELCSLDRPSITPLACNFSTVSVIRHLVAKNYLLQRSIGVGTVGSTNFEPYYPSLNRWIIANFECGKRAVNLQELSCDMLAFDKLRSVSYSKYCRIKEVCKTLCLLKKKHATFFRFVVMLSKCWKIKLCLPITSMQCIRLYGSGLLGAGPLCADI